MNNQWFSKIAVWLVIALVLFTVFKQFDRGVAQGNQVGYSDFLEEVRAKRIKSVVLQESAGGGTEIGSHCTLRGCIVAGGVRIGDDCVIDGMSVLGEGVTIGSGNTVSNGARLFPGVSLPDGALQF